MRHTHVVHDVSVIEARTLLEVLKTLKTEMSPHRFDLSTYIVMLEGCFSLVISRVYFLFDGEMHGKRVLSTHRDE